MSDLVKFSVTDEAIQEYRDKYTGLSMDQDDGYKLIQAAIRDMVSVRTGVEAFRKEKKAPLLEASKFLDTEAKRITKELQVIEDELKSKKKVVDDKKAEEKAAKAAAEEIRIANIKTAITDTLTVDPELLYSVSSESLKETLIDIQNTEIDPEYFLEFNREAAETKANTLDSISSQIIVALERERAAEDARLQAAAAEAQRLENEKAAKELADAQAELERQKKEVADAAQKVEDDKQAAIDAAEAKAKAEKEAAERKEFEAKAAKEAKEKAEAEAKAEAERKEQEAEAAAIKAKEDEEQRLANLSDAEFIDEYIHNFLHEVGYARIPGNDEITDALHNAYVDYGNVLTAISDSLKTPVVLNEG
tara:strand:+ start:629 stop:1717 length:1089 start_codon:yes stop_codon:yes gene_type:complete